MKNFFRLIFPLVVLVTPGLNRKLWEQSVPEISTPSEHNKPIQLQEDNPKIQIAGLRGTLRSMLFTNFRDVSELRIIKNQISEIESGALCPSRNLKILELDLSGNKNPPILMKSMFDNCNLEELFLKFDYNNPSHIDKNALEDLKKLKILGIDSLRLTHLEKGFLKLGKNLTCLMLSNIHVETIDANAFDDLTKLEELEIIHNIELEHIPEGVFKKCAKLKHLNMKDNAIKNLSWNEFEGLSSLEELNVQDNRIENFNADKIVKNMPRLKTLIMEINAIECEKEQEFVIALTNKFKGSVTISTNRNNFLCAF